jgi:hypothetical protein
MPARGETRQLQAKDGAARSAYWFGSPAEATKEGFFPFGALIGNVRRWWTSNIAQP